MLKSHLAKVDRIRGGFGIDMLEMEWIHGDIVADKPQFAFRFSMRLGDAKSLADAIYSNLDKRPPKKIKDKETEVKADNSFTAVVADPAPVAPVPMPPATPPQIRAPAATEPVSRPGMSKPQTPVKLRYAGSKQGEPGPGPKWPHNSDTADD